MTPRPSAEKVVELASAKTLVEMARNAARTIVWTNGCFDLLHVGHVTYLEAARNLGDLLIVGLNDDASVEALKGPGRPIMPLSARMRLVAALECVDLVVAFGEATPLRCIETLRPNVIVKGGDYRPEHVVGGAEARRWGGRVAIVPFVDGWSTTGIAGRLKHA